MNKNYSMSCLFFLFFFIGWGCCYPYLSLWLTETIGISYTDVGLVYSFTAIIAVCVQPLFGFISDKLWGGDRFCTVKILGKNAGKADE